MLGGYGDDRIFGLDGNDHLEGDPGNDFLDGGNGDDRLQGRKGADHLVGGEGNDHLEGNFENDVMEGGNGNDYLEDNLGQNVFSGGDGNDYIQAANNGIRDTIDCGPGADRADVDAQDVTVGLRGREALAQPLGSSRQAIRRRSRWTYVAEVEIDRPASEVFDYLADGEKMPRWMKEFTAVEKVGDGPIGQGTEFRYHDKRGTDSTYELSEYQPPGRLAWHGAAVKMPGGSVVPGRLLRHPRARRAHARRDAHAAAAAGHGEADGSADVDGDAQVEQAVRAAAEGRPREVSRLGRLARRFGYRGWQQFTQLHVRAYRASRRPARQDVQGCAGAAARPRRAQERQAHDEPADLRRGRRQPDPRRVVRRRAARPVLVAQPEGAPRHDGERLRRRAPRARAPGDAEEKARIWPKMVEVYAPYADYQRKTERDIPVVILEPAT